jgi:hypothetical protein
MIVPPTVCTITMRRVLRDLSNMLNALPWTSYPRATFYCNPAKLADEGFNPITASDGWDRMLRAVKLFQELLNRNVIQLIGQILRDRDRK